MSLYTLDGNSWGGSFILEASTDGTSWEPMVAKSDNGTYLCRQGLQTGGGVISSGYNSFTFSNTQFSIYKPTGSSIPPDTVTALSIPVLTRSSTTACTVTLSRIASGFWDKTKNIKEDFSVHCVPSTNTSPYWSAGTQFNCIVTGYNSTSGVLSFSVTPTFASSCKFYIIVRNEGTGMFSGELLTSTFTIKAGPLIPTGLVIDVLASEYTTGANLTNRVDNGSVPMRGTYSIVIRNSNTGIYFQNENNNDTAIISGCLLPKATVRTLSMWVMFPTNTANAIWHQMSHVFDGRTSASNPYYLQVSNNTQFNPRAGAPPNGSTQIGSAWASTYYHNGGAAKSITTFFSDVQTTLNVWHHVTLFLSSANTDNVRFTVFTDWEGMRGADAILGRISVYSSQLTQAENAQNYNVGF